MAGIGRTGVVLVDELFPGLGSVGLPVTPAVLLKAPAELGLTTIVIVVLAPLARFPKGQVTVAVPLQVPWLGEADTKVTPPGRRSVTVTPVALAGPLFVTARV